MISLPISFSFVRRIEQNPECILQACYSALPIIFLGSLKGLWLVLQIALTMLVLYAVKQKNISPSIRITIPAFVEFFRRQFYQTKKHQYLRSEEITIFVNWRCPFLFAK
ncbi:hypothetical protein CW304_25180 [Bacillus sp. UFRGS-B20]|nr:hypothetical protein CW304_25180 [Bacillus sp. UFRGS-B20]